MDFIERRREEFYNEQAELGKDRSFYELAVMSGEQVRIEKALASPRFRGLLNKDEIFQQVEVIKNSIRKESNITLNNVCEAISGIFSFAKENVNYSDSVENYVQRYRKNLLNFVDVEYSPKFENPDGIEEFYLNESRTLPTCPKILCNLYRQCQDDETKQKIVNQFNKIAPEGRWLAYVTLSLIPNNLRDSAIDLLIEAKSVTFEELVHLIKEVKVKKYSEIFFNKAFEIAKNQEELKTLFNIIDISIIPKKFREETSHYDIDKKNEIHLLNKWLEFDSSYESHFSLLKLVNTSSSIEYLLDYFLKQNIDFISGQKILKESMYRWSFDPAIKEHLLKILKISFADEKVEIIDDIFMLKAAVNFLDKNSVYEIFEKCFTQIEKNVKNVLELWEVIAKNKHYDQKIFSNIEQKLENIIVQNSEIITMDDLKILYEHTYFYSKQKTIVEKVFYDAFPWLYKIGMENKALIEQLCLKINEESKILYRINILEKFENWILENNPNTQFEACQFIMQITDRRKSDPAKIRIANIMLENAITENEIREAMIHMRVNSDIYKDAQKKLENLK